MTNIRALHDSQASFESLPNATPEEHAAALAYLRATGNDDLEHYFFGGDAA